MQQINILTLLHKSLQQILKFSQGEKLYFIYAIAYKMYIIHFLSNVLKEIEFIVQ